MPFVSEVNEITKIKSDAIANSFGLKGRRFGRICSNIYSSLNDPAVEKQFKDADYNIGELFVTSAGSLPCKYIINILAPFAYDDDEALSLLTKAYKDIIDKALELKCHSLAIPMLGTGNNGYERSQSYTAFTNAISDLLALEEKKQKDILDVHLLVYYEEEPNYDDEEAEERRYESPEIFGEINCSDGVFERKIDSIDSIRILGLINEKRKIKNYIEPIDEEELMEYQKKLLFLLMPRQSNYVENCSFESAYRFVDSIIDRKNMDKLILNKWGLERRMKNKLKNNNQSMTKHQIFMSIIALNMNVTEALQVLTVSNHGFNVTDEVDRFMIDYLAGELPNFKNKCEFDDFFEAYKYLMFIKYSIAFKPKDDE